MDSNSNGNPAQSQEEKSERRGMTYIDRLNQFNKWVDNNYPGDKVISLYIRMLNVFNQRHWPEWAGITTPQLMALVNTSNPNVALAARNKLVEAGFLEYRPGHKGTATTYKLLNFVIKYDNENMDETNNENRNENAGFIIKYDNKNSDPIKTKTVFKNKSEDEEIIPPNPPTGGTGENFPVSSETSDSSDKFKGRRERRERNATQTEPLSPDEESALSTLSPRLYSAVRDWVAYKAEARRALTPTQKRALLEQIHRNVREYGAEIVAQTVEESTASGYAGIAWSRAALLTKAQGGQSGGYPSRHVDENGHFRYNPGDTTGSF